MHGFVENKSIKFDDLDKALKEPTDKRLFAISQAFSQGYSIDRIYELTKIDKWFLNRLKGIVDLSKQLHKVKGIDALTEDMLRKAKKMGFSDFQIARAIGEEKKLGTQAGLLAVRNKRKSLGIVPYVKQIDTLGGEYQAQANYLYMTYNGSAHDIPFFDDKKSIIVIGSGAYRIGSSVEFDWCGVQALNTVHQLQP